MDFDELAGRLEVMLGELDSLPPDTRDMVFVFLDDLDTLHRRAVTGLATGIEPAALDAMRERDPAVAWLCHAYGLGVDEIEAAEAALESIRPYIESHGGKVEVLGAAEGVVRLRMSGSCAGCSASAVTLSQGIEEALREHFPGYAGMEVAEDTAPSHPPPGPTLLQIQPRPT